MIQSTVSQHWLGLTLNKQQALFTWTNCDWDLWCYKVLNDLQIARFQFANILPHGSIPQAQCEFSLLTAKSLFLCWVSLRLCDQSLYWVPSVGISLLTRLKQIKQGSLSWITQMCQNHIMDSLTHSPTATKWMILEMAISRTFLLNESIQILT